MYKISSFKLAEACLLQYCPIRKMISLGVRMSLKLFSSLICVSIIVFTTASLASQPDHEFDSFSHSKKSTITCQGTCFIFDYDAEALLQQIPVTSDSLDGLNQLCVVDAGTDIHPWVVRNTSCD
jgi:hypothetical protein